MIKQKRNLTIAIPAHNEGNTLQDTLNSLNNLITKNYTIEKFIFISDGSTDNTIDIFKKFKYKNTPITIITDEKRRGKIFRLNQIYKISQSEILIIFDGDILIRNNAVEEMINNFKIKKTIMVAAHQIPIKPKSLMGNIIYTGYQLWDEIRLSATNNNDIVQNFYGAATAYHKKFYKNLHIPERYNDERRFIYSSVHRYGKFIYAKKAIIYYHPISTLRDFVIQSSRSRGIDNSLEINIKNKNKFIPISIKTRVLFKFLLKSPFYTISFLLLKYIVKKIIRYQDPLVKHGMWSITTSTKRKINKRI